MRRYIVDKPLQDISTHHFDVVVVGGGLSGLYTALLLDKKLSVAVLAKSTLEQCNSALAQGGIAAVVGANDNTDIHLLDTLTAAVGMADSDVARLMVENGPAEVARLASLGVKFDADEKGNWRISREGAHSRERILHCGGDATGKLIMDTLIQLVKSRFNIQVFENCFLSDLITGSQNAIAGVVAFQDDFILFNSAQVVLATGGIGGVFRHTTNHQQTTGDGIAAAIRAGARLDNMEFVQFHPTAFFNCQSDESFFLISEAVRGEGAILRNMHGDAFMQFRHRQKDLAPRDVVAREIFREMSETGQDHVFLDITSLSRDFLLKRFPTIYNYCAQKGYQLERDLIPVLPVQHYFMGGIKTDSIGQTSIPGLYACGETACTGVHGANRLASNSLLECIVFAAKIANAINFNQKSPAEDVIIPPVHYNDYDGDVKDNVLKMREMMQSHGGIVRSPQGLIHALNLMDEIIEKADHSVLNSSEKIEMLNISMVSREILLAALYRRESIGSHYLEEEIMDETYTSAGPQKDEVKDEQTDLFNGEQPGS